MPVRRCGALLLGLGWVVCAQAQTAPVEAAAPLRFEVASIRPAAPGVQEASNVDLDPSDYFRYQGGGVVASGPLINYLSFAYRLQDRSQADALYAHLPAWTRQPYTLRATAAEPKPTKDQLRLMVQTLLAERFQLKLHTELRQLPVYVLVVDHAPAPGLVPAPVDGLCTRAMEQPKGDPQSKVLPRSCQLILFRKGELIEPRMADQSIGQIAGVLVLASRGALEPRPVLDKTGLSGRYDLDIAFLPPKRTADTTTADATPEEPGASFEEALKRQAGLKLLRQTARVPIYVVDRIEPPSEN